MKPPEIAEISYVIDGLSLLQRILWKRDGTFTVICESYVLSYVKVHRPHHRGWVVTTLAHR